MTKTIKHIISLFAVTSLLVLSFSSCKTAVEPPVDSKAVLANASTKLVLPVLDVTKLDIAETSLNLPQTINVDGHEVKVDWTTEKDDPRCVIQEQGKKLALKRDLIDLSYSLKATLSLNNEKTEKKFDLKVPAIKKFQVTYNIDPENPWLLDIEFLKDTFTVSLKVQENGQKLVFSYTELNTVNSTMKITFKTTERPEDVTSVYKYEINGNNITMTATTVFKDKWYHSPGKFKSDKANIDIQYGTGIGNFVLNGTTSEIMVLENEPNKFGKNVNNSPVAPFWKVEPLDKSIKITKFGENDILTNESYELSFIGLDFVYDVIGE